VIAEEERHQLKLFKRIIPSDLSHKYLKFMDKPSYFDKLFDAFEQKYSNQVSEFCLVLTLLYDELKYYFNAFREKKVSSFCNSCV